MYKSIFTFIIISFFITIQSDAQDMEPSFPKIAIGLSPSSLINIYSGFQVSADIRIKNKVNLANELTYIFGLLETPGFRFKSGLQYCLKKSKATMFTVGSNLSFQRVRTDVGFDYAFSFSERGYNSNIFFNQNRIAGELTGAMRLNVTKKLYMEFGLGAGLHHTRNRVKSNAQENLRQLLIAEPEYTYEEMSKNSRIGLLTSFNINVSYVIEE